MHDVVFILLLASGMHSSGTSHAYWLVVVRDLHIEAAARYIMYLDECARMTSASAESIGCTWWNGILRHGGMTGAGTGRFALTTQGVGDADV